MLTNEPGLPSSTNQKSTNETYRLKDSHYRYSKPSLYVEADSNTFRIPDNRNTFAVRAPSWDVDAQSHS